LRLGVGADDTVRSSQFRGRFQDVQQNREAIGENQEDEKPQPLRRWTMWAAFVRQHMRELFERAGIKTVDSGGGVTIKGEVVQFFVRETSTSI